MSSTRMLALFAMAAGTVAVAATEARMVPTRMTSEAFLALPHDARPRIVAWLDGYARAGKPATAVPVALRKQVAVLDTACAETPQQSLWQRLRAKLLSGSKTTVSDPSKMTCADFLKLRAHIQPEVLYWLDGYNRGAERGGLETAGTKGGLDGPLVALDRDVAGVVRECRDAPTQGLWEKVEDRR
jgi:hypothetical protein